MKVTGYILTYHPKDKLARTHFHHALFGRNDYRTYRGKKYCYYDPGFLHNVNFAKLQHSSVFISKDIDVEELKALVGIFGDFNIKEEIFSGDVTTGKEFWEKKAKKLNLQVRYKKCRRI